MILMIFLLLLLIRVICLVLCRVIENRLGRLRLLSCFFGWFFGFISIFYDLCIFGMFYFGGCGGVCWMYLVIRVICFLFSLLELF